MSKPIPVDASPTKQFFVKMLTRDIELLDAILDLLDNCIDGIVRMERPKNQIPNPKKPYEGFYAKITATPEKFLIDDNCGGIPEEIAKKVAFRLGRPTDEELEKEGLLVGTKGTVGLYGIGMKRAIFKMGREATVETEHGNSAFRVEFSPAWMDSGSWALEMIPLSPKGLSGTRIEIKQLNEATSQQFSTERSFLSALRTAVSQLFAVIIDKGFLVEINNVAVAPVTLALLFDESSIEGATINPYVFKGTLSKVTVEVVIGFYKEPAKAGESDSDDEDDARSDIRQAGWSIICNDRLVLYGDKSINTGWGMKPIPRFHNQYNAIAGIVTMRSDKPELLPFNTTKHGIELTFGVYLKVLDYMKDGARQFVDFTNNWKGRLKETTAFFANAKPVQASEIPKLTAPDKYHKISAKKLADDESEAEEYKPQLKSPPRESTVKQIRFSRPAAQVAEIGKALLDDAEANPKDVGETCFDKALNDIRKAKKK